MLVNELTLKLRDTKNRAETVKREYEKQLLQAKDWFKNAVALSQAADIFAERIIKNSAQNGNSYFALSITDINDEGKFKRMRQFRQHNPDSITSSSKYCQVVLAVLDSINEEMADAFYLSHMHTQNKQQNQANFELFDKGVVNLTGLNFAIDEVLQYLSGFKSEDGVQLQVISKHLKVIKDPGESIIMESVEQINGFATEIPKFNSHLQEGRFKLLEMSRAYLSPNDQNLVSRVLVTDLGIGLKI